MPLLALAIVPLLLMLFRCLPLPLLRCAIDVAVAVAIFPFLAIAVAVSGPGVDGLVGIDADVFLGGMTGSFFRVTALNLVLEYRNGFPNAAP